MKTIYSFLIIYILFPYTFSHGQTIVQGGIYENTVWTKAKSPYLVKNNIVIFEGVKLSIEPGVTVRVAEGMGIESRGGYIYAEGTSRDSIYFKKDKESAKWKGMIIKQLTNAEFKNVNFKFVSVSDAKVFLDLRKDNFSTAVISRSRFTNNDTVFVNQSFDTKNAQNHIYDSLLIDHNSVVSIGLNPRLTNSEIADNDKGFYDIESLYIFYNNIFKNNKEAAIKGMVYNLEKCTFANNGIGLYYFSRGSLFPVNADSNIFINNKIGVLVSGDKLSLTNNKICNSIMHNIKMDRESNINATNNCWCTNDSTKIRATIYDGYIDLSVGLVKFMPFISCNPIVTEIGATNFENDNTNSVIFPNPTNGNISIQKDFSNILFIDIYNYQGIAIQRIPIKEIDVQSGIINNIDILHLPSGVYYLKSSNIMVNKMERFVVIK